MRLYFLILAFFPLIQHPEALTEPPCGPQRAAAPHFDKHWCKRFPSDKLFAFVMFQGMNFLKVFKVIKC